MSRTPVIDVSRVMYLNKLGCTSIMIAERLGCSPGRVKQLINIERRKRGEEVQKDKGKA